MRAVLCTHLGPPETLEIGEMDDPIPGDGEVVVDVTAAALNFMDTLIIEGRYQVKPELPFSPGAEFAGTVSAIGNGVNGLAVGDRVLGNPGYGAGREKVLSPAQALVHVPASIPDEKAAGLSVTYGTAIHALKDRAQLQPGEKVAILGASGGAGIAAVEIARIMGAHVIACVSSPEKAAFCRERGAHETLIYAEADLKTTLKQAGGASGIDVIYDAIGGPYSEPALRALAWKGRFLVIGFAAGDIPTIPLNLLLLKGCDIRGVFFARFAQEEPEAHRANLRQLLQWCESGALKPHVDAVYALDETADAISALAERRVKGKVVVKPSRLFRV